MMPNLENLDLKFGVDDVLRGQGANPTLLRSRNPALVNLAEKAMVEGFSLIEPQVICKEFSISAIRHESLLLDGGGKLKSKLIINHLAKVHKIYVLLCTIGSSIEKYAEEMWASSASYSLALDGVGSAAVEALANAACRQLEIHAQARGWQTSTPLSPGMIDWPVAEGQLQIFELLKDEKIHVQLSPSFIMLPRKSLTMIVGVGPDLGTSGSTCDYCNLRDVCRYKDHY